MEVFDFHCDTLYKSMINDLLLDADIYEFKISDLMKANKWHQCMAVWTPDDRNELPLQFRDKPLIDYFIASAKKLISECKRLKITFNDINANKSLHLTVENSSILEGNIENIEFLKKYGVKVATLTWNDSNCIGDGVLADKPKGATAFGKQVINEYIKNNIAIDVSHTSDDLFYDIASSNPKYILATHSNSREICSNKRNITDEQFEYIKSKNGVVGLNFHKYFLSDSDSYSIKDILNHAYHFLSLGGEDNLCIGTDMDGSNLVDGFSTSHDFKLLYNSFIENNFKKSVVDKIFFENGVKFYDKL